MLCLSGFELYSRWVPLPCGSGAMTTELLEAQWRNCIGNLLDYVRL